MGLVIGGLLIGSIASAFTSSTSSVEDQVKMLYGANVSTVHTTPQHGYHQFLINICHFRCFGRTSQDRPPYFVNKTSTPRFHFIMSLTSSYYKSIPRLGP